MNAIRFIAAILSAVMLAVFPVSNTAAPQASYYTDGAAVRDGQYLDSGLTAMPKLSRDEIRAILNAVPDNTPSDPEPTPTPTPTPAPLLGDVNSDGAVDANDALLVLRFVMGLVGSLPDEAAADFNGDGSTDSVDALLILRAAMNII